MSKTIDQLEKSIKYEVTNLVGHRSETVVYSLRIAKIGLENGIWAPDNQAPEVKNLFTSKYTPSVAPLVPHPEIIRKVSLEQVQPAAQLATHDTAQKQPETILDVPVGTIPNQALSELETSARQAADNNAVSAQDLLDDLYSR